MTSLGLRKTEAEAETRAEVPDERRDSLATRLPDQGDDLEEFYSEESDEVEDIKKEDDNPDGDGGVAQASPQHELLMTDSEDDSEVDNEENSRARFQEDSTSDDKAQRPLLMTDSENDSEVDNEENSRARFQEDSTSDDKAANLLMSMSLGVSSHWNVFS
eukprot:s6624_g1.t1